MVSDEFIWVWMEQDICKASLRWRKVPVVFVEGTEFFPERQHLNTNPFKKKSLTHCMFHSQ